MAPEKLVDGGGLWGGHLLLFRSLPSTNAWALKNIHRCGHGDVVCASRQTAGKGRFLRSWLTPPDRGLAVSIVLRSHGIEDISANAGQIAALAVRDYLGSCSLAAMLKWPNDILVRDRKIAGILVERDSASGAIVLGLGLNVNVTGRDLATAGLAETATSMRIERKRTIAMAKVRAAVLAGLQTALDDVISNGLRSLTNAWLQHDYLAGAIIEVSVADSVICGRYEGMDAKGRLCLVDESGLRHLLWSADVRKVDGSLR